MIQHEYESKVGSLHRIGEGIGLVKQNGLVEKGEPNDVKRAVIN